MQTIPNASCHQRFPVDVATRMSTVLIAVMEASLFLYWLFLYWLFLYWLYLHLLIQALAHILSENHAIGCFRFAHINAPISGLPDIGIHFSGIRPSARILDMD
jgi:hypothetical protein